MDEPSVKYEDGVLACLGCNDEEVPAWLVQKGCVVSGAPYFSCPLSHTISAKSGRTDVRLPAHMPALSMRPGGSNILATACHKPPPQVTILSWKNIPQSFLGVGKYHTSCLLLNATISLRLNTFVQAGRAHG